uniref:IRG-type G domain-containing protein n=1 Tax=Panagrolaimus superbus TaxID=310955 RepID=A0A914Z280_9BILA
MPNVRFYDVPGSGAMSHKAANYYEDKALCGFDCLVILVQQTLAEEEIKFALAALEYNQKVVFVRSKCDIDFHLKDESGKNLRSIPSSEEIREHINELRFRFNQELRKHATLLRGTKCFFVSSKSLRAKVRNEIPDMNFEESEFLEYLHHESRRIR